MSADFIRVHCEVCLTLYVCINCTCIQWCECYFSYMSREQYCEQVYMILAFKLKFNFFYNFRQLLSVKVMCVRVCARACVCQSECSAGGAVLSTIVCVCRQTCQMCQCRSYRQFLTEAGDLSVIFE